MTAVAVVVLRCFVMGKAGTEGIMDGGNALGWPVPVAVHAPTTAGYTFREKWEPAVITNQIKEFRAKHDMKQEDLARIVHVRREMIGES